MISERPSVPTSGFSQAALAGAAGWPEPCAKPPDPATPIFWSELLMILVASMPHWGVPVNHAMSNFELRDVESRTAHKGTHDCPPRCPAPLRLDPQLDLVLRGCIERDGLPNLAAVYGAGTRLLEIPAGVDGGGSGTVGRVDVGVCGVSQRPQGTRWWAGEVDSDRVWDAGAGEGDHRRRDNVAAGDGRAIVRPVWQGAARGTARCLDCGRGQCGSARAGIRVAPGVRHHGGVDRCAAVRVPALVVDGDAARNRFGGGTQYRCGDARVGLSSDPVDGGRAGAGVFGVVVSGAGVGDK